MGSYYNELDPFAAAWLRELIKAGHIAPGEVDEKSITEVQPDDLKGFEQCHFFAGIGVWSYALRCAGWPDDRPVWTGSCPCPSFSAAGKGAGFNDPRHLWPDWYRLIRECRPAIVFGEQVNAAIGHGWLDLVQSDLEAAEYAVGKAVLGACSVGAPHIRQRLYFVAQSERARFSSEQIERKSRQAETGDVAPRSRAGRMADAEQQGFQGHARDERDGNQPGRERVDKAGSITEAGGTNGFWAAAEWLWCRDGKYRPTQPGLFPLASGVANRVGTLRGAGNALCAPVAQAFIEAYLNEPWKES